MDTHTPSARRLRDLLLESGPVSTQRSRPPVSVRNPERDAVVERIQALIETMFLMMKADDEQSEDELDALRRAIRNLTDRTVPTRVINRMLGEFETRLSAEGRESRRCVTDYALSTGKTVRAVVAGHMHQATHDGGRPWMLEKNGVLYINAARVPRIFATKVCQVRYHIALDIDGDSVTATDVFIEA